jgi:hypothetical protein
MPSDQEKCKFASSSAKTQPQSTEARLTEEPECHNHYLKVYSFSFSAQMAHWRRRTTDDRRWERAVAASVRLSRRVLYDALGPPMQYCLPRFSTRMAISFLVAPTTDDGFFDSLRLVLVPTPGRGCPQPSSCSPARREPRLPACPERRCAGTRAILPWSFPGHLRRANPVASQSTSRRFA